MPKREPTTEELRRAQQERATEEHEAIDTSFTPEEERQHRRRADKSAYLERKLAERERSERRRGLEGPPVRLALIADTHLPRGNRRLPDPCLDVLRAADLIVHAGDLSDVSVLAELRELGRVAAVHGNVDSSELRRELPESLSLDLNGVDARV